ncbi:unnamed protein product [Rhizoctonia solani]|uniref:MI domain-containing protein n=1 Tax=Rhizoctonia solani TaxID=456999 RepID=A0A8H3DMK0_9AGAM|nr:unnamed protein product [Rhizoctonia solani]
MLWNAKNIEDLRTIHYPVGVNPPDLELNFPIEPGRFRYERNFLLQFKSVCTKRPDSLPPLDSIGIDPSQVGAGNRRGPRGGRGPNTLGVGGDPSQQRQAPIGLGLGPGLANRSDFAMGQFQSHSNSQSRFEASNAARGLPFTGGRTASLTPMSRSESQGGAGGGNPREAKRTRAQRGRNRPNKEDGSQTIANPTTNIEPSLVDTGESTKNQLVVDNTLSMTQEVERKVTALLNKLSMGNFDSISDQIIEWVNNYEQERIGATLIQVTKLIFERAKEEAVFSEVYARLCHKMMERLSPKIQDQTIRNSEGQAITGGMLFRKYLLSLCKEAFKLRWGSDRAAPPTSDSEDEATGIMQDLGGGRRPYPNQYYVTNRTKRQGVSLARFMGELFGVQILTERVTHKSIKALLSNVINPEEEMILSLCTLLATVGPDLDKPKTKNHMDSYFKRIEEIAKGGNISFRMQFALLDVIELRARHWQLRHPVPHPTPLHQDSSLKDLGQRNSVRGGYRRGEYLDSNAIEPEGRNILDRTRTRPSVRASDLSQFGKISKPAGIQFGPSSLFNKKSANKRDPGIGRAVGTNMFALITDAAYVPPLVEPMTNSRRPRSLGTGGFPVSAVGGSNKRFNRLPRTNPSAVDVQKAQEGKVQKRVNKDVKEYLAIGDVDDAIIALEALPSGHRHLFVDRLINAAMDGGNRVDVVILVEKLFSAAHSRSIISPGCFERGLLPTIEMADDLSIDEPKTYEWLARMIHAAGIDKAKAEEMAGKILVYGNPPVSLKELLIKEYDRVSSA